MDTSPVLLGLTLITLLLALALRASLWRLRHRLTTLRSFADAAGKRSPPDDRYPDP